MNISTILALFALYGSSIVESKVINQCSKSGMFAMTWDDGPAQYTDQLLGILSQKGVQATFHVSLQNIMDPGCQKTIKKIAGAGHLVGLRTDPTWDLGSMDPQAVKSAIGRQCNVLSSFIGYTPKFIRVPYGSANDKVVQAIESLGLIVTGFNIETYDYTKDSNRIYSAIKLGLSLKGRGAGSFISVQRDGIQSSVAVAPKIIDAIEGAGYKLVRLDECLGLGDTTENSEKLDVADDGEDLDGIGGGLGSIPIIDSSAGQYDNEDAPEGNKKFHGLDKDNAAAIASGIVSVTGAVLAALFLF